MIPKQYKYLVEVHFPFVRVLHIKEPFSTFEN